ncbi:hypothetical protein F0L74_13755 [Chitinophaga agrisoli]|uniref:Allene oxide cyclase barrel-like domain-containing protein n=1 Tax=Chitinophaga agrisoli TaxID=2607653 RepID=A0A5B2VZ06_9BACT|nr:hypothetical protein [Chitinophaga agrisoli]KAA2243552.1 hypothetical protein F0L74_13755 [Chitinophaga agrisoli]
MRTFTTTVVLLLGLAACRQSQRPEPVLISLNYTHHDIQLQFDTLYNHQQTQAGVYNGLLEQALANCHSDKTPADTMAVQDVSSSMYLNFTTGQYDCVTTTTFKFSDGIITAAGVFNLTPGDTIAPDHDFPITGGSGAYQHIYGTYTRKYEDGVYRVELRYFDR